MNVLNIQIPNFVIETQFEKLLVRLTKHYLLRRKATLKADVYVPKERN